jgi:hypothetical protein
MTWSEHPSARAAERSRDGWQEAIEKLAQRQRDADATAARVATLVAAGTVRRLYPVQQLAVTR